MGPDPGDGRPAGHTVVVTRSEEDNRRLVVALARIGCVAVEAPLVEITEPADGGRALTAALDRLGQYRWVVLTSVNGVNAVRDRLGDRSWPVEVMVAPVGPTTASAARSAGMTVADPPPVATAAALVDRFEPWDGAGGRLVLAPLAELAGGAVEEGLGAKGYLVDRVEAYRTVAPTVHRSAAEEDRLTAAVSAAEVVTFFSPSVVDRFLQRYGPEGIPASVVCIGPATANRALARGLTGVVTADPHSESGVVDAVAGALGLTPPHG